MTDDDSSPVEDEYDVVEKLEEFEKGHRLTIKSKRGTGTNDRDEVQIEYLTEDRPSEEERMQVASDVTQTINYLRSNQPVEEED